MEDGILLLVMTDGRGDYLRETIAAFDDNVTGPITHRVIHDDSGDLYYTQWLTEAFPSFTIVTAGKVGQRSGFDGAYRSAWAHIATMGDYRWVFTLEDDFTFQRPVDLADVIAVLEENPHLSQMAFRRQAWLDEEEQAAGGFAEKHAERCQERSDEQGREWVEHRLVHTTNPNLARRNLMKLGWPKGERSEDRFWRRLCDLGLPWGVLGDDVRAGFWGSMGSGHEWVHHIGHIRTGHGY